MKSVQLISADDALDDFRSDPEFGGLLAAIDRNPLPHTIIVRPDESATPVQLRELESSLSQRDDVDLVKLDTDWVRRLNAILDLARRGVYVWAGNFYALALTERLGLEVGFYQDPYSDYGRLSYEMWRACRLVVDTGIHAKGWSRQRAVDYLASNTALSMHEVGTEIDRYIAWPGQAARSVDALTTNVDIHATLFS